MNTKIFSKVMFALLFFFATGCSDDQEIFFEDYANDEAPEVVHPDQRA